MFALRLSVLFLKIPVLNWFIKRGYLQGIFWTLTLCFISSMNDVLACFLGERLHFMEIMFFRFFFSTLSILPFMFNRNKNLFKTKQLKVHLLRAVVGASALSLCCFSVSIINLAQNTAIMFCEPIFFLPMAYFFLKEKIVINHWIATFFGFIGLLCIIQPGMDGFQIAVFFPMTAALLFAYLCVMAKKMILTEHTLTMLFYFGLKSSILASLFLPFVWVTPTLRELLFLGLLGIGANFIQVCLFRSYIAAHASSLTPFRYFELLFSGIFGLLVFNQELQLSIVLGAIMICFAAFYSSYFEIKKSKKHNSSDI